MAHAIVLLALLVWCGIGSGLVRRAERAVAGGPIPLPWRDVAAGIAVALVAVAVRPPAEAALCGAACVALVVAGGADARTGFLFDAMTLPCALLVAGLALAVGSGAAAAAGVALLVGTFGAIVVLSRGAAMGLGDVKALYAVGAAFGPTESLLVIFFSCASGIADAVVRGAFARRTEIRFGPHLAIGSTIALVAGKAIRQQLLGL